MEIVRFNPLTNYIGCAPWQKRFTNRIAKKYPEINFACFKHDLHYILMFGESNIFIRIIMKIMYDVVFLVLGVIRCLIKLIPAPIGALWVIVFFIALILSSIYYLWINRKKSINFEK